MHTANQIRQKFLDYFKENNHQILPSSSLVPNNDKSLLFTNAGMIQFKDFFLDLKTPKYKRVATSQNVFALEENITI